MYDLVIKGALVRDGFTHRAVDVGVADGRIAALGYRLEGKREIVAEGLWLLPGVIDAHVHLSLPFAAAVSADDFTTGSQAGACGGVTTMIDFMTQKPGEGLREGLERRLAEAEGKCLIDYSMHALTCRFDAQIATDLPYLRERGVSSLKVFTAYRKSGMMIEDGELFSLLEAARDHRLLVTVHAENGPVIDMLIARYAQRGDLGARFHPRTRPVFTEVEAVQRVATLAEAAKAWAYIVHTSCGSSVPVVEAAQQREVMVFSETCPQYLWLDDGVFERADGHCYASCPPVRPRDEQEALVRGIVSGAVSVVATDHCPFTRAAKNTWNHDFRAIPMGLPGIETLLPLTLARLRPYGDGAIDAGIRALTANPARLFGMYPRKGSIQVGADADLVIFDPNRRMRLGASALHMATDLSPYDGLEIDGWPVATIARGELIVDAGRVVAKAGRGQFVRRESPQTPLPVA